MALHFGSLAEKEDMLIDFNEMKREYQTYENWNPFNREVKRFSKTNDSNEANKIA